jgi:hypothetical protein
MKHTATKAKKKAVLDAVFAPAASAPCRGFLTHGSELGEIVLLECAVRAHAVKLHDQSQQLHTVANLLARMRDNIKKRAL